MFEDFTLSFLNPYLLLLLPVVWVLCWAFFKYYKTHSMWHELCDEHLLNILVPTALKGKPSNWLAWIMMIVCTLIIIAASGPSWRTQPIPLFESAASRVVVLDLSRSMMAEDVQPTRFERAVFKARDLIDANQDGQTALIAFAGAAFLVSPLTDDKQTLLNFLGSLKPEIMPVQGSRVDLAISMAEKILTGSLSSSSQIYILSDGVSELESAVNAAQAAVANGLTVSILALGTAEGGPLKDASGRLVRDKQGELIIAKVGFEDLQMIAEAGKGRFIKMTASDQDIEYLLSGVNSKDFNQAEDSDDRTLRLPVNDGVWLVWLILPLALLLFRKNALWIILFVSIVPVNQKVYALDWGKLWKNQEQRAFEAYQQGDYEQARKLSARPQLKGSAYYKSEDYQNAEQAFAQHGTAQAFYNRGNALAQQQQFDKAIGAYDKALQQNPQLEDAKHNKELIEEFLKQQQSDQINQQNKNEKGEESSNDSSDQSESEQSESDQSSQAQNYQADDLQSDSTQETEEDQFESNQEEKPEEQPLEELAAKEQTAEDISSPESIDRWINRLPDDPSELLRRKFLRDYQRHRSQP